MNKKVKRRKVCRVRSSHSIVEDLAELIKNVYTDAYQRKSSAMGKGSHWTPGVHWNGGTKADGTKRPNIWLRAAKFALKHEIPAARFVVFAVFEYHKQALPRPTNLVSEMVLCAFKQSETHTQESRDEITIAFDGQRLSLDLALDWYDEARELGISLTDEEIKRRVLLDVSLQLSALFRYCLAESEGLHDIADDWLAAAILQFISAPKIYVKVWKDWIPEGFREEAQQLCRY